MAEKLRTLSLTPKRNFLIKDNECSSKRFRKSAKKKSDSLFSEVHAVFFISTRL